MDAAWASGDFTGAQRPMVRATIQHMDLQLFDLSYNLYSSFILSLAPQVPSIPLELPNIKSCKWSRGIDTDVATATIEVYNTAAMPIGSTPGLVEDIPGYYSFRHAESSYARQRWGQQANEWQRMIQPDNLIRTFEGYGFNSAIIPEKDPHLVQTGVWVIKSVAETDQGLITIQCEDMSGVLLRDQIVFHPVIPKKFYPVSFTAVPPTSGIVAGYSYTKVVTSGGQYDRAHPPPGDWHGPTAAPTINGTVTTPGTVGITSMTHEAAPSGYRIAGYQIVVDNQRQPTIFPTSAVQWRGATNGVVYLVTGVVVWEQISTGRRVVSSASTPELVSADGHPGGQGSTPSGITQGSVNARVEQSQNGGAAQPVNGLIGWSWFGYVDHFVVIVFSAPRHAWQPYDPATVHRFVVTPAGPHGNAFHNGDETFQTNLGDLRVYDILVYPVFNDIAGAGDQYIGDGWLFSPPTQGYPPHEPSPPSGPVVKGSDGTYRSVKPTEVSTRYDASSSEYYYGPSEYAPIEGHEPHDAFDADPSSYWLSVGNYRADQEYSYEWIQARVPGIEVSEVRFATASRNLHVYVSVFANNRWVTHTGDVVPYRPTHDVIDNGSRIPYFTTMHTGEPGSYRVTLPTPVPGATKVRLTFYNLNYMKWGPYHYRVTVTNMAVWTNHQSGYGAPIRGPVQDDDAPTTIQSYVVHVPPKVTTGAGAHPGYYEDYTDIVKLFCAWGGLFWSDNALERLSDGSARRYNFGYLYGVRNVDPVLGDSNGGRVWGDLENTGVAGIAELPIAQWDKQSLLDGISYVRDIIGYNFYIDELGSAVWRLPNWFAVGNNIATLAASPGRTQQLVNIDEEHTLLDITSTRSGANTRERYFIASTDGKTGAVVRGYLPNPVGLRRVGGWTDQHFASQAECTMMGDLIALRAYMAYHTDSLTIPGYPRIQIDDQVRIFERVTSETYLHYVRGISSTLDLETGEYTYQLDVNWLGSNPDTEWVYDRASLSGELAGYLAAVGATADIGAPPGVAQNPGAGSKPPGNVGLITEVPDP